MARTALTVQDIALAGITPSYAAANADGNSFDNQGGSYLQVKNGSGSQITVTIPTPAKVGGVDLEDITVTVAATTGDKVIGPFAPELFNQSGGVVHVNYSAVTTITAGAFKLN